MIAEVAIQAFDSLVLCRTEGPSRHPAAGDSGHRTDLPPIYEFTWNHTTLQALKVDRSITYHQSLFPPAPERSSRSSACIRPR